MAARLGKDGNRQAGVSLHLASDGASAAVGWRLFLPESGDPASPKFRGVSSIGR
ncbi:transposase [Streptomyces sp. NPDC058632]|uniref:transposase n=1 Tax=Streptomyces sp. NPDC058632 TaxID=3346567 RepID=UPI00364D2E17